MKHILTILLYGIPLILFGCIHKTATQSSPTADDLVFTTPPKLLCAEKRSDTLKFIKGGALTGGRSRVSVMRGVMSIMGQLRTLYKEEYPDSCKPCLKVVVFFKVDYLGNVVSSNVTETNSGNLKFDTGILAIIKSIKFDQIDKKHDITEIRYPFVFSN